MNLAPSPALGTYAEGFAPVATTFASALRSGAELGAGVTVYHRGRCVVDLWGGKADVARDVPWERDTRVVLFSVTKGLAAMALSLLADRGKLEWDAPVATHWPEFAQAGKGAITLRTLFNHRAGLAGLDEPLTMDDCLLEERKGHLRAAMEKQVPLWEPGTMQGYHAITFGMYAREVLERIAGESMGAFLARELFEPLGADVSLGTPASLDGRMATLYPPSVGARLRLTLAGVLRGGTEETRVARAMLSRRSMTRRAFTTPALGSRGMSVYGDPAVRRAQLAWASATGNAHGVARAYLPFAGGGAFEGRTFLKATTLEPVYRRQGWSERDAVLHKPLGWSQGFLKEETRLFSPNEESFGHAGMGGALGWCDPVAELTFGYVMNRLDPHVRSPRALALCHALYACEPLRAR
ncbi:MAG TPA: serine hydrolase domain-containing protein [Polyangiaceae bacterium]